MPQLVEVEPLRPGISGVEQTVEKITRMIREGASNPLVIEEARRAVRRARPHDTAAVWRELWGYVTGVAGLRYRFDPVDVEHTSGAHVPLAGGDCDDFAVRCGAWLEALGYPVEVVVSGHQTEDGPVYGHVYVVATDPFTGQQSAFDPVLDIPGRHKAAVGDRFAAHDATRSFPVKTYDYGISGGLGTTHGYTVSGLGATYGHTVAGLDGVQDSIKGVFDKIVAALKKGMNAVIDFYVKNASWIDPIIDVAGGIISAIYPVAAPIFLVLGFLREYLKAGRDPNNLEMQNKLSSMLSDQGFEVGASVSLSTPPAMPPPANTGGTTRTRTGGKKILNSDIKLPDTVTKKKTEPESKEPAPEPKPKSDNGLMKGLLLFGGAAAVTALVLHVVKD